MTASGVLSRRMPKHCRLHCRKASLLGLTELLNNPPGCRDPDEVRPTIGFTIDTSRHIRSDHVSVLFRQVVQYWIDHHTVQLVEAREHLMKDLDCDVSACEAERRPAEERIPDRLRWPAHLIEKLCPVGAEHARPI